MKKAIPMEAISGILNEVMERAAANGGKQCLDA